MLTTEPFFTTLLAGFPGAIAEHFAARSPRTWCPGVIEPMNNANKKKQDEIKNRLEEIVRREYTGHYPLPARQCLHWARQGLYPVLIVFLPDLERDLREEGKVVAAERVSAITQEVRGSL